MRTEENIYPSAVSSLQAVDNPDEQNLSAMPPVSSKRGADFWLVFVANLTVDLLSALDLVTLLLSPLLAHVMQS